MKPMSGLSRMFINIESERFALDGALILVLDPSTAPGGHDYQRVRTQLAARIPGIAVFTRRAIAAPLAAGHERWVTDPTSRSIATSNTSGPRLPTTCQRCAS